MPKIKTHSGAKKRFSLTKTGKVKRAHAYKNHILNKKSTKRKEDFARGRSRRDERGRNQAHDSLQIIHKSGGYELWLELKALWRRAKKKENTEACQGLRAPSQSILRWPNRPL